MLTEIVDGVEVQVSAQKEIEIKAEWAADDAVRAQEKLSEYLEKRNIELANQVGQLMTLLFNDISAGTPLNSGTYFAAVKAINDKYPKT